MKMDAVNITDAEWELLEIVWRRAPLSAREIYQALPGENRANYRTVRTQLDRMAVKGVLARSDHHGLLLFRPEVSRQNALKEKVRRFFSRFFQGDAGLAIAHVIEEEALTDEALRSLRELLERKVNSEGDESC